MDRQPVVAGQFYPGQPEALKKKVVHYMQGMQGEQRTLLAMVPHAGYIFSGRVAGKTLAAANLADRMILLGPNHTGRGSRIAVWPDGRWHVPGASIQVDTDLSAILTSIPGFEADYQAHLQEHSLEVVMPFVSAIKDNCSMVPVAVSHADPQGLMEAGQSLGREIKSRNLDISLIVSSDMSHYISHEQAKKIDSLALERILALDPAGLYRTVREYNISMCGVLPMVLGLSCALELGARNSEMTVYATSGEVNNDYSQVVGYAGILVS
ncbi:MAG: AmmeMemoRadiSam system protein B [Desulfonatronovibrionaceae bacterium]